MTLEWTAFENILEKRKRLESSTVLKKTVYASTKDMDPSQPTQSVPADKARTLCYGSIICKVKGQGYLEFNPFPNKPWFLRVCSTSLLKTL